MGVKIINPYKTKPALKHNPNIILPLCPLTTPQKYAKKQLISYHYLHNYPIYMKTNQYQNIVFLTGAGISAPSGLVTFRGSNGLWNNYPVEKIASIEGFRRNPDCVHAFYNDLKPEFWQATPNAAHLAITRLQQHCPDANISVITQNIDTLHEKAGNRNVCHIHGQIDEVVCEQCGNILKTWKSITTQSICPYCYADGSMRPNIVFFREPIKHEKTVEKLLEKVDLFIAVGTSGEVYPAAGFAAIAKRNHAKTMMFNLECGTNADFDEWITGNAAETLPKFVNSFLSE